MPVRGEVRSRKKADVEEQKFEYSYDEVVDKLRLRIDEEFGGVAKFLESELYKETGLGESKQDKAKMFTYLSNPTEDGTRKVKSFPVIQKLLEVIEGATSTKTTERIVRTVIVTNKRI